MNNLKTLGWTLYCASCILAMTAAAILVSIGQALIVGSFFTAIAAIAVFILHALQMEDKRSEQFQSRVDGIVRKIGGE